VISQGGDAAANAGIVGGMIGAYKGSAELPKDMMEALTTFNCLSQGRFRPEFLSIR